MWTQRSLPPTVAPRRHVGWRLEPRPSQIQQSNFKHHCPPLTSLQCSPWNQGSTLGNDPTCHSRQGKGLPVDPPRSSGGPEATPTCHSGDKLLLSNAPGPWRCRLPSGAGHHQGWAGPHSGWRGPESRHRGEPPQGSTGIVTKCIC